MPLPLNILHFQSSWKCDSAGVPFKAPIPACIGVFGFCYEHVIQKYKKFYPQASSPKHKAA